MEELKLSSFDVAQMVLDDANERFAPSFVIDAQKLDIFRQYCTVIDKIIKEFDGETLEFSVDEISMLVTVKIGVDEIVVDNEERSVITDLLSRAVSFKIENGDDSPLLLTIVFPSLWGKRS